jgi:hypothetical protein
MASNNQQQKLSGSNGPPIGACRRMTGQLFPNYLDSCVTKTPFACMDLNAKSCYDRIMASFGMLCSRILSLPNLHKPKTCNMGQIQDQHVEASVMLNYATRGQWSNLKQYIHHQSYKQTMGQSSKRDGAQHISETTKTTIGKHSFNDRTRADPHAIQAALLFLQMQLRLIWHTKLVFQVITARKAPITML